MGIGLAVGLRRTAAASVPTSVFCLATINHQLARRPETNIRNMHANTRAHTPAYHPHGRLVLENSGVAEPQNLRDQFTEAAAAGHPIMNRIRLDAMVGLRQSELNRYSSEFLTWRTRS